MSAPLFGGSSRHILRRLKELADEQFMATALHEAKRGLGRTSPNPMVGALLVRRGEVVARGHHRGAGKPHAEAECLSCAGSNLAKDATLYVTLEPCSTTGRTPPCTDAIIASGVRRVVIGTMDPNPQHAGRALELLRDANVEVRSGVLDSKCARLNEAFNKWIVTRQPFVIAKCGMSLDGRLTRPPNESQWLTSEAARRDARKLRASVDAILIGAQTLRADDPRLTVRGVAAATQPLRVVVSRSGKLPQSARLFTDKFRDRTLVFTKKELAEVLTELGARDVTSVLIEGGGEILSAALDQRLIDKVVVYLAPFISGGRVLAFGGKGAVSTAEGVKLRDCCYDNIAGDVRVTGYCAA